MNLKSLAVDSILKIVNGKEAEDGKESTKFKTGYRTVNYWSNIEQFTDIFNVVLFDGEEVIKPEETREKVALALEMLKGKRRKNRLDVER